MGTADSQYYAAQYTTILGESKPLVTCYAIAKSKDDAVNCIGK